MLAAASELRKMMSRASVNQKDAEHSSRHRANFRATAQHNSLCKGLCPFSVVKMNLYGLCWASWSRGVIPFVEQICMESMQESESPNRAQYFLICFQAESERYFLE